MTKFRLWGGVIILFACLGAIPLHAQATTDGATYLITINDATTGAFASRGAITLHSDGTLSIIDSGQGGPTFFFSSQLGAWGYDSKRGVVGRTLDFDFPPSPDVARLDYTFTFSSKDTQVTGTITLTIFPLQGNPLDGGGTVEGQFTFTGTRVNPS
jgi:hypothetical protein